MRDYKLVNFCEFDKYAAKSYCAIHNVDESLNLGDITKVDENNLSEFNMICGGSPCQDFSVAGKQKGSKWLCEDCGYEYNPLTVHWSERDKCPKCRGNLNKTRSSLLVEYLRVIRANKPNFGIYENVKNIVGKQFRETTFKMFEQELNEYGYNTYWEVLNAKNYGIPQNRERVYLIFVKKELDNGKFQFPKPFNNNKKLKDLLEKTVDERFYISKDKVDKFIRTLPEEEIKKLENQNIIAFRGRNPNNPSDRTVGCPTEQRIEPNTKGISNCLTSVQKDNMLLEKPDYIGNLYSESYGTGYAGCVWNIESISPTLTTMQGGGRQPHIVTSIITNKGEKFKKEIDVANTLLARDYKGFGNQGMNAVVEIPQATKKGYVKCEIGGVADLSYPKSKTRRGRVQEGGNVSPTITATETSICRIESPVRIRKLTPKECFRLMGFEDCDYEACVESGISNSQLYKQAGNSIVVDVLYYIFKELYIAMPYLFENLKLSSFFSGIGAFEKALDRLYKEVINCQSI